jgi:hypothetical protein
MEWWRAALWGLAGGFCLELWNLHLLTRQTVFSWRHPIPQGLSAYTTAVVTRLAVSCIVAADEVRGVWVTFGIGVAAPVLLQRLASEVPLTGGEKLRPAPEEPGERVAAAREPQALLGSGDGDGDPR